MTWWMRGVCSLCDMLRDALLHHVFSLTHVCSLLRSVSEELPEEVKASAPTEYVFSVKELAHGSDPAKVTYLSASTVSACAELLGAMAPIVADMAAPSLKQGAVAPQEEEEVTPEPPKKGPPAVGARRTSANLT